MKSKKFINCRFGKNVTKEYCQLVNLLKGARTKVRMDKG
jgi:hypothetical protein